MLKKKIILLLLVALLVVPVLLIPVSAAGQSYNYMKLNPSVTTVGDMTNYKISPPDSSNRFEAKPYAGSQFEFGGGGTSATVHFNAGTNYNIWFRMFRRNNEWLEMKNIPNGSTIKFTGAYEFVNPNGVYIDGAVRGLQFYCHYFDSQGNSLGADSSVINLNSTVDHPSGYPFYSVHNTLDYEVVINKPAGAVYMGFTVLFGYVSDNTAEAVTLRMLSPQLTISVNTAAMDEYRDQTIIDQNDQMIDQNDQMIDQNDTIIDQNDQMIDQNDTIIDQNDQMIDQMETLPGEIGNEIQGVIDKEDQEAQQSGEGAAGEIMDIVPNESEGFMNALGSLVGALSYNGTVAKLPIPPIVIPAISGVMDELKLTDKLEVDFGYWVQQIPGDVLEIVQIVCTVALIVYCFKELYSTISYAMTLKGGGNE